MSAAIRRFASCLILSGALLAGCGEKASETAEASSFPARAPGLWEQQTSILGLEARGISRVCVDAASDQTVWAFALGQGLCALKAVRAGGVHVSECRYGGLILTNETKFSGDFSSAYEMNTATVMTAAEGATPMERLMASNPAPEQRVSARRIGACEAGQRPGDFFVDGALVSNLMDRAADLRPAP